MRQCAVGSEHAAHDVAVHVQLPGDGADTPLLDGVQAQDLRNQVRGYGHGATLNAGRADHGHDARSPGAPNRAVFWHSGGTARVW
jgi:hypothetical protein